MTHVHPVFHGGKNYPEQVTDEFLCCYICKLPGFKAPRILQCGHTFCLPCIEAHLIRGPCVICALCGLSTQMPIGGPVKLSRNIFVDNQVDRLLRRHNKDRGRDDARYNINCYNMDNPWRFATFMPPSNANPTGFKNNTLVNESYGTPAPAP